ncbi:MAG: energy transducer TonB [Bacteroidota bacterium]
MKKERKPKTFLQGPSYPGGPQAMRKFLSQQIKYPDTARKEKISGTVRLRIDINYKGKVTGAKVLTSLGYGCDEEAQRVVRLLQFEVPKQRKIKAIFHKTMNINFKYKAAPTAPVKLPSTLTPTHQPAAPTLQYTVVKNSETVKGKVNKRERRKGYDYTIEL